MVRIDKCFLPLAVAGIVFAGGLGIGCGADQTTDGTEPVAHETNVAATSLRPQPAKPPAKKGLGQGMIGAPIRFIGHPKGETHDSNGNAIMIPLVTKNGSSLECDGSNGVENDTEPTFTSLEPDRGVKIYFEGSDRFEIVRADGTVTILVPVTETGEIDFDMYVRALGKPGKCLTATGWAFDSEYYFWSGTLTVNRNKGKPVRVNANDLFDVWYCDVEVNDLGEEACVEGTTEELSVFDSIFAEYFWDVENNGLRNLEIRLYNKE